MLHTVQILYSKSVAYVVIFPSLSRIHWKSYSYVKRFSISIIWNFLSKFLFFLSFLLFLSFFFFTFPILYYFSSYISSKANFNAVCVWGERGRESEFVCLCVRLRSPIIIWSSMLACLGLRKYTALQKRAIEIILGLQRIFLGLISQTKGGAPA